MLASDVSASQYAGGGGYRDPAALLMLAQISRGAAILSAIEHTVNVATRHTLTVANTSHNHGRLPFDMPSNPHSQFKLLAHHSFRH